MYITKIVRDYDHNLPVYYVDLMCKNCGHEDIGVSLPGKACVAGVASWYCGKY